MAILTTVIFSLNALTDAIAAKYDDLTIKYDPTLDYERAMEDSRSQNRYDAPNQTPDNTELPLLLYNRSSLRRTEMSRGPRQFYEDDEAKTKLDLDTFSVIHAEYDFRFMFIDKNIEGMERFEVDYISRQMISSILECSIDLSDLDLGEWNYFITWNQPLDDFVVNTQGSSYISITGSATVRGFFISMVGTTPVITRINEIIKGNKNQIIEQFTTPKET